MQRIIFFDGICPLCNAFARYVFKIDKNRYFKYASLQSTTAQKLLVEQDLRLDSVVLYDNQKTYNKSTAILRILFQVGGLYTILALLISIIPKTLRDYLYSKIAENRFNFFKAYEECPLPEPDAKDYFLN